MNFDRDNDFLAPVLTFTEQRKLFPRESGSRQLVSPKYDGMMTFLEKPKAFRLSGSGTSSSHRYTNIDTLPSVGSFSERARTPNGKLRLTPQDSEMYQTTYGSAYSPASSVASSPASSGGSWRDKKRRDFSNIPASNLPPSRNGLRPSSRQGPGSFTSRPFSRDGSSTGPSSVVSSPRVSKKLSGADRLKGITQLHLAMGNIQQHPEGMVLYRRAKGRVPTPNGRFADWTHDELAKFQGIRRSVVDDFGELTPDDLPGTNRAAAKPEVQGRSLEDMRIMDRMKKFDVNQDGQIDFNEFKKACVLFGKAYSNDRLQQLFRQMDKDNSGQISMAEFITSDLMDWERTETGKKLQTRYQAGMEHENTGHARTFGDQKSKDDATYQKALARRVKKDSHADFALNQMKKQMRVSGTMSGMQLWKAFQFFDTDGNGTLNFEEMKAAMQAMQIQVADATLEYILTLFDKDGTKTIDYNEFVKEFTGGYGHAGIFQAIDKAII